MNHTTRRMTGLGIACALTIAAAGATARAVAIDFENPPYTTGAAVGQDGWASSAAATIVTTATSGDYLGGQAISPNSSTDSFFNRTGSGLGGYSGNPIVQMRFDLFMANPDAMNTVLWYDNPGGAGAGPQFGYTNSTTITGGFVIRQANGGTTLFGNGLPFSTYDDHWVRIIFEMDPAAGTGTLTAFDLTTGGTPIATGLTNVNLALAGSEAPAIWDRLLLRTTTNSAIVVDNIATAFVPAPAALPAGLAMLGLLAVRRRRR